VLVALCSAGIVHAELKIGYINSEKIFNEYEGTRKAQEAFDKEVAKLEQKAEEMKKEITELRDKLQQQSLLLSNEQKKKIQDKLQQKMIEYQTFLKENLGRDGEVVKKNMELTKPIIEKINQILQKIGKEENYDYIFDARGGAVVYAKDQYDLTQRVLTILNKEGE
jgi:outer membrane protein